MGVTGTWKVVALASAHVEGFPLKIMGVLARVVPTATHDVAVTQATPVITAPLPNEPRLNTLTCDPVQVEPVEGLPVKRRGVSTSKPPRPTAVHVVDVFAVETEVATQETLLNSP